MYQKPESFFKLKIRASDANSSTQAVLRVSENLNIDRQTDRNRQVNRWQIDFITAKWITELMCV